MQSQDPIRALQLEVKRLKEENGELRDELAALRTSVRSLSALQDIIQRINANTNVIKLIDDLLISALAALGTTDGSLLLRDDETEELVFAVVHGQARDELVGYRLPAGRGIAGWVATNRQPQIISNVRKDDRFYPLVDETFGFQTQTLACVPLLDGNRVLGVIEAVNKYGDNAFTPEDHDLLVIVAQLVSLALVRAESFVDE
ncbi:MAG: GAF domain-containing protein [Anaerolineales bacterium]|jgi:GAF domain-containing protein